MIDVTIFLSDLGGGGAERVMVNLANSFAQQGKSVDLILVYKVEQYLSLLHASVRVINLDYSKLLKSLPFLISYLKKEKPKILLSAIEDTNIIAICATKLAGVKTKVVVTVHNHLSSEVRHATNFKRRFVPYFLRYFYPHASSVVAVSKGVAVDLVKWTGLSLDNIKAIYNPVIPPNLQTLLHEMPNHPWLNQKQLPVILGIGRLDPQKDFPTLIHAFAQVRRRYPAKLIILGEGSQRNKLEQLINQLNLSSDVHIHGFVKNPYAYMSKSSLCVLSSAWEGFGNVIVEAMAVGTPVVSTDCTSGPAEILADGKYGKLVPVGDIEKMAEAIIETLHSPLDSQILQQRANFFTIESATAQYEQLFCQLN